MILIFSMGNDTISKKDKKIFEEFRKGVKKVKEIVDGTTAYRAMKEKEPKLYIDFLSPPNPSVIIYED